MASACTFLSALVYLAFLAFVYDTPRLTHAPLEGFASDFFYSIFNFFFPVGAFNFRTRDTHTGTIMVFSLVLVCFIHIVFLVLFFVCLFCGCLIWFKGNGIQCVLFCFVLMFHLLISKLVVWFYIYLSIYLSIYVSLHVLNCLGGRRVKKIMASNGICSLI